MIRREDIARAEYVVRTSAAIQALGDGMARSPRGRKPRQDNLELLAIGLLLSIQDRGVATVQGAHRILTEEIEFAERLRLGSVRIVNGREEVISLKELYHQANLIKDRLAYGKKSTPHLSQDERDRRHQVVVDFNNKLMDAFDIGWDHDVYALDATGIWSWARGGKSREKLAKELIEGEADEVVKELEKVFEEGEDAYSEQTNEQVRRRKSKSKSKVSDGESEPTEEKKPPRRRRRLAGQKSRDAVISGDENPRDDGLGYTISADADGHWGVKTGKNGKGQVFFGYHEHTLVIAPDASLDEDPAALPPLIRRLELTTAGADVVDVSLRMITSLGDAVKDLLVDNHYHYKGANRWLDALMRLGIRQHHDLRSDEQGFIEYERIKYAAGWPHCPRTPVELGTIDKLPLNASKAAKDARDQKVNLRRKHAARIVEHPTDTKPMRCECPAEAGTVGCPLKAGTVATAQLKGLPIIANPPDPVKDGEPLPEICLQQTVTVRPPEPIRKLYQRLYWFSDRWQKMYRRRTYVEGSYGNRKNVSTENLRRGLFQSMGLPWSNFVVSLVAASYNVRMIMNWHDRTGLGDTTNPLFVKALGTMDWKEMTAEDRANEIALYEEALGMSSELKGAA